MAKKYAVSQNDHQRIQKMLRWYEHSQTAPPPQRRRNAFVSAPFKLKIFEVQSAATGDGVYNCIEQTLDATDWTDTAGADKFNDKEDATEVEVLNLLESHPVADYSPALCLYDRLACWKWSDDDGNSRWVGMPIESPVRRAMTTEAAPSAAAITCNIILNNGVEAGSGELGYNVEVSCDTMEDVDLDVSVPKLADDTIIYVQNIQGTWYSVWWFNAFSDCAT